MGTDAQADPQGSGTAPAPARRGPSQLSACSGTAGAEEGRRGEGLCEHE